MSGLGWRVSKKPMRMISKQALVLSLALVAPWIEGCSDDAYCFDNCGQVAAGSGGTSSAGTAGVAGTSGNLAGGNAGNISAGGNAGTAGSGGACTPEICDGLDNDCDGTPDNVMDPVELAKPTTCGNCETNCFVLVQGTTTPTCTPPATVGNPGVCGYTTCSEGFFDVDGDKTNGCEYVCTKTSDTETCDGLDNNCDGKKDETFDFCAVDTCGSCSTQCVLANATPACTKANPALECPGNAQCVIDHCDAGWVDRNHNPVDGCEFQCTPTADPTEICDGVDNDCDGLIDGADDLSGDIRIIANAMPVECNGAAVGICSLPEHKGTTACVNAQVVCQGPNVIVENQVAEICNGLDDDCDGFDDDSPMGEGDSCGPSNIFPCSFGTKQCQLGTLNCVGAVLPGVEICNGVDDDCDGEIDKTAGVAPSDSVGACDTPIPPPAGVASACSAGLKACTGGVVTCVGSVLATSTTDACNIDSNCDGSLTGQPDTNTDVHNCGGCGNDCYQGSLHANWSCVGGSCHFDSCLTGYYDNGAGADTTAGDHKCGYACTFVSAAEACNNADDNCDGQVDENVAPLAPKQVCGVSPSATSPECTTGVTVTCQAGVWACTFPPKVCDTLVNGKPSCATTPEICDLLDNNCNGSLNETTPLYGKSCASDDAMPGSDGACRTTGVYQCLTDTTVKCSAVKADCATLPGGCTELCDGIDNDCDGSIDETYKAKGTNSAYFVKPEVVKIGGAVTGPWIYAYEASRAGATSTSAGLGNGFVTAPPTGEIAQATHVCSTSNVVPWSDVSPREAEQACFAAGGRVCAESEWQRTCEVDNNDGAGPSTPDTDNACNWAYDRVSGSCTAPANYAGTTYCNMGGFDFDTSMAGDQDGVLPTHSPLLKNCEANWNGYNGVTTQSAYDMTGNVREISRCQVDRAVCGTDAALCAVNCCSSTSTAVTQSVRICGTIASGDNRRLAGQLCTATTDCCNLDTNCTGNGLCNKDVTNGTVKYCENTGGSATSCRARGVACTAPNQCCNSEPCSDGFCGGKDQIPNTTYPLMGGSYATIGENGATCDFDFYKVTSGFKLYDTGFRCCFDSNPDQ